MKTKVLIGSLILLFVISLSNVSVSSAQTLTPQDILKKKYPNEIVTIIKTMDVNSDNKKESFILTDSGNFYLINAKGSIVLINTGFIIDGAYYDEVNIQIYSVSSKEKHIAITGSFSPSNTQLYVYRLQDGTLKQVLKLMGDLDVQIDKKGRIHQLWRDYYPEGGWEIAEGIFTWNTKINK
ncbi:hypothetical protein J2T13_003603 [Paenibacillus sp. DS2015]|uniref:hypothetical protein n=1 Tax=Paenibacillus sp. DS2015 TaxID=3373917 RepID=UPI003D23EF8B